MISIQFKRSKSGITAIALTILLMGTLLFCLSGCGGDKDTETSKGEPAAVAPAEIEMEETPSAQTVSAPQQELQQKITRFNQLKGDLKTIQDTAIENTPELKEQQEALQLLVQETLQENLKEAGLDLENIKQMQQDLQQADMSEAEKEALAAEFRQKVQQYTQVQRETMADATIQEKTDAFRDGLEKAMKKENPQSGEMMEELKALIAELQQLQIQQQQVNQPQPVPEASVEE